MPSTTDDKAVEALQRAHGLIAERAPEAPTWDMITGLVDVETSQRWWRSRPGIVAGTATAVAVAVLVAWVVLPAWWSSSGDSASSSDLPNYLGDVQAVVTASELRYVGEDEDARGPLKVYEAPIDEVVYEQQRYGELIDVGETLQVVVPARFDEARIDVSSDRVVGLLMVFRDAHDGPPLLSQWRLWGVFDPATHAFIGPAATYNRDLHGVLPFASTDDLGAWAAERDAIDAGGSPGEYTAAWNAYQQRLLDERGVSWGSQDPRVRSLDPLQMPTARREEVTGVPAIIQIPDVIADDPQSNDLSISLRSPFGVVHQARLSVGAHYAVLWSRPDDPWEIVLLRGDALDGATLGTVEPGGARNSEAVVINLTETEMRRAIQALDASPQPGPSDTPVAIEPISTAELNQLLNDLAAR